MKLLSKHNRMIKFKFLFIFPSYKIAYGAVCKKTSLFFTPPFLGWIRIRPDLPKTGGSATLNKRYRDQFM